MICPSCKLENSADALKCNCGFDFKAGISQQNNSTAAADRSPKLTVKDLLRIESRLNLGFYAAVVALIIYILINAYFAPLLLKPGKDRVILALLILAATFFAFAGYLWYLVSICMTAKAISKPFGLYLLWAVGGPILSLLPIPFVSIALAATPLIIRFLLSGELRTMIRLQTLRDLH